MSDLRAGTSTVRREIVAGIERGFEPRDFRVDVTFRILEPLLQHFEAFLGARDILRFVAHARRRARRAADAIEVGRRERLAAEQRTENRAADGDRGLHLLLRELALLALAALIGAADLVLELLQLRLPAIAQLGDRGVALLARREREPRAEVAFGFSRPSTRS